MMHLYDMDFLVFDSFSKSQVCSDKHTELVEVYPLRILQQVQDAAYGETVIY